MKNMGAVIPAICGPAQAAVPILVHLAAPVPRSDVAANFVTGLVGDCHPARGWAAYGAIYADDSAVWFREGIPLVLDPGFVLGTKTVTEMREEVDEDES